MCFTLKRHIYVLYTDAARSTHRFIPPHRRFGMEVQRITTTVNIAPSRKGDVVQIFFLLLRAFMTPKHSEMVALHAFHVPTNFYAELLSGYEDIMIFWN